MVSAAAFPPFGVDGAAVEGQFTESNGMDEHQHKRDTVLPAEEKANTTYVRIYNV